MKKLLLIMAILLLQASAFAEDPTPHSSTSTATVTITVKIPVRLFEDIDSSKVMQTDTKDPSTVHIITVSKGQKTITEVHF